MPANYTLHLGLTKEQMEWISRNADEAQKSKSKFVQDIIEASKKNERLEQKLESMITKISEMERLSQSMFAQTSPQLEIILAYVKEIFRESSANLYRLNAMVDEFAEPETVRSEVNEFVRKQESMMRLKVLKAHEVTL